ncbi:MAG TPA: ASCH domain-containing protein [Rhabdochlamydiaceae bacterium]|nr:ASCH domain-containing protein [Rhabdochlamydiaceae bacterium]
MSCVNKIEHTPPADNGIEFISLSCCKKEKFGLVQNLFRGRLLSEISHPDELLNSIWTRKDEKTEFLTDRGRDIGLISYKRKLSGSSFEMSTLALFDPKNDAKKGYGTHLLQRIESAARDLGADSIVFKNRNSQSLSPFFQFLEHKGFEMRSYQNHGTADLDTEVCFTKNLLKKRKRDDLCTYEDKPVKKASDVTNAANSAKDCVSEMPPAKKKCLQPPARMIMNHHELTLKREYIPPIRMGKKTVEGRIDSGMPSRFKAGDTLRLYCAQDEINCRIVRIDRYRSFREMLEQADFRKCIPEARTIEEALGAYTRIPGYMDRAKQHGVLAIHLETV